MRTRTKTIRQHLQLALPESQHISWPVRPTADSLAKEDLQELCANTKPYVKLSGRSGLHCYFWPASYRFLKDDGPFGFATSSDNKRGKRRTL